MHMRFINADELRRLVSMADAVEALEAAFLRADIEAPQRARHETSAGDLLVMPAWNPDALGVKLVTVNPQNAQWKLPSIHGTYTLFDGQTMAPRASIDAEELTRIRTAAVSALATKYLAPPQARHLVVFGAGAQADGHIEAMCAVRPIAEVTIVSRTTERAQVLAKRVEKRHEVTARLGEPAAVEDADIICTCTTSSTPLFDGELLKSPVHINAVGSYRPDARELDDATMRRAAQVVVENKDIVLVEAGDIVQALANEALDEARITQLPDVLRAPEARSDAITVFKSVGLALEDLAVAQLAFERTQGT